MKLVGMLDSPYVRRVAISLQMLGLRFEHESLSVFRHMEAFRQINPVIKVPTMVCDDGTVLLDSTLILEYAESVAHPRSLRPAQADALVRDLRLTGLALAACEKSVQIVYEHMLRPPEKLHAPWLERVTDQLRAACDAMEKEMDRPQATVLESGALSQGGITAAVAWHFIQAMTADAAPKERYLLLQAFSLEAEKLPAFRAAPHGEGVCRPAESSGD
ncbi:glutathione S-transferase [Noviherbaspirillum galbum]|uniref:Glutathione S-transferase n=1 Tax=Noviherbaspirillum galbum TaxID=2709383 RepID=A0A6B3SQC1_9BURK|nr:glutathione S-transferase [Noviherbaspirillum galbum]NEX62957.1 glutathione S-transferase [Noviherbaspirillum galbum]